MLTALTRFDWSLGGVDFAGGLPTELGELTLVTYMMLANAGLTGTIPSELARVGSASPSLVRVDLSSNALNGSLPTHLGLFGRFSSLCAATHAWTLPCPSSRRHRAARLSTAPPPETRRAVHPPPPPLPSALPPFRPSARCAGAWARSALSEMSALGGSLPTELALNVGMTYLDLHQSGLTGGLPTEIGQLSASLSFRLYGTSFSGIIPTGTTCARPALPRPAPPCPALPRARAAPRRAPKRIRRCPTLPPPPSRARARRRDQRWASSRFCDRCRGVRRSSAARCPRNWASWPPLLHCRSRATCTLGGSRLSLAG